MSQNNDMNLSLSGEAFAALRSDFNEVLHSTMTYSAKTGS